jgi:hypothetical protein
MNKDSKRETNIEKAKRAIGSILNLIRYQPIATQEQGEARLRLLDQFASEAFAAISDVEASELPSEVATRDLGQGDMAKRISDVQGDGLRNDGLAESVKTLRRLETRH